MPATPRDLNITAEDMELHGRAKKEGVSSQEEFDAWLEALGGKQKDSRDIPQAEPMWKDDPTHLTMYSMGDLANLPKTEWLVDGLLEKNQMNLFYGPSGTGKTAIVSELVWSWMSGVDHWLEPKFRVNQSVPQGERRAIYVLLEGLEGYFQRADAWVDANELGFGDLAGMKVVKDSLMLFRERQVPNEVSTWAASLQKLAMNIQDYQPQIVVIDTLYRATAGMDVNKPDMSSVIGALQELINMFEITLVILHHSPKANRDTAAGHGSLENAVSVRILVEKDGGGSFRTLKVKKYRNAEEPHGTLATFSFNPHREGFVLNKEASKGSGRPSAADKYLDVVGMSVGAAAEYLDLAESTVRGAVWKHPQLVLENGIVRSITAEEVEDV